MEVLAPEKPCVRAARAILADLGDRRGIKWELEKCDEDVLDEMVATWAAIIARLGALE